MTKIRETDHTRIWLMVLLAIIALIGILTSGYIPEESHTLKAFVEKTSEALFIASLLGLTIDTWMKRQIADDVFRASIGHLLPDELKSEIRWVYGFELLCDSHVQTVKIEKIQGTDNLVTVISTVERRLVNISGKKQSFQPTVEIDEWNIPNYPSEILDFGFEYGDSSIDLFGAQPLELTAHNTIKRRFQPIQLASGESIKVWFKVKEIKHSLDFMYWVFTHPTSKPIFTVEVPPGYECHGGYGHREDTEKDKYTYTYRLPSTLLPTQHIGVKWWPVKNKKGGS